VSLELKIEFSKGLEGVNLRHSVWETTNSLKTRSLYSDWKFKTEQDWNSFKTAVHSVKLAGVDKYRNFYAKVKQSIIQVEVH
jgi:hypothetical protein